MEIKTVTVRFLVYMFVNSYILNDGDGFILIDTGTARKRNMIERGLEDAGCRPGDLKLIAVTHGDPDHAGNAAYLRQKFGAKIAMHADDVGKVKHGDMFLGRNDPGFFTRTGAKWFYHIGEPDRFTPDITIEDGDDLTAYGFNARVVHIPGHSGGSIGFLTNEGDLFCGDLLANVKEPGRWQLIDDPEALDASINKVKGMEINTVYPGHGKPFLMEHLKLTDG